MKELLIQISPSRLLKLASIYVGLAVLGATLVFAFALAKLLYIFLMRFSSSILSTTISKPYALLAVPVSFFILLLLFKRAMLRPADMAADMPTGVMYRPDRRILFIMEAILMEDILKDVRQSPNVPSYLDRSEVFRHMLMKAMVEPILTRTERQKIRKEIPYMPLPFREALKDAMESEELRTRVRGELLMLVLETMQDTHPSDPRQRAIAEAMMENHLSEPSRRIVRETMEEYILTDWRKQDMVRETMRRKY